jgi:hypothetical protein
MITLQGYLKTRIYAMGARINERKCKNLRDSHPTINKNFPLFLLAKGWKRGKKKPTTTVFLKIMCHQSTHRFAAQSTKQGIWIPKIKYKNGEVVFHTQGNGSTVHYFKAAI